MTAIEALTRVVLDARHEVYRHDGTHVRIVDAAHLSHHLPAASGLLDRRERARAARFRFRRDRDAYIAAHAIWRVVLGERLGMAASDVQIDDYPGGQPRVNDGAIATSLSHSGSLVAVAVSDERTVGVDIEQRPSRVDLRALAPRFCHPREHDAADTLPSPERDLALLELWTRKEAVLKAFGIGLAADPASVNVADGSHVEPPPGSVHNLPCLVRGLGRCDAWVAAVAVPTRQGA